MLPSTVSLLCFTAFSQLSLSKLSSPWFLLQNPYPVHSLSVPSFLFQLILFPVQDISLLSQNPLTAYSAHPWFLPHPRILSLSNQTSPPENPHPLCWIPPFSLVHPLKWFSKNRYLTLSFPISLFFSSSQFFLSSSQAYLTQLTTLCNSLLFFCSSSVLGLAPFVFSLSQSSLSGSSLKNGSLTGSLFLLSAPATRISSALPPSVEIPTPPPHTHNKKGAPPRMRTCVITPTKLPKFYKHKILKKSIIQ